MPTAEKENATLDSATMSTISSQLKEKSKKSRSKSIGPGGLDALKETSGNRGDVRFECLLIDLALLMLDAVNRYFYN